MKTVFDTDFLSIFAKTDSLNLLLKLFNKIYITPKVFDEILVPLEYGYNYPNQIINSPNLVIIQLNASEIEQYRDLVQKSPVDKAELESIVLCKNRNYIFATMDKAALKFAKSNNVFVFDLHTILKSLWKLNILSKSEVKELIEKMEKEDRTTIPDKKRIFDP